MKTQRFILMIALATGGLFLSRSNASAGGPFQFYSVAPCRILDTRLTGGPTGGAPLTGNVTYAFQIAGFCNIPSSASQVILNVIVVGPAGSGNLRVWPYDGNPNNVPLISTINFDAGISALANGAVVTLGAGNVYVYLGTGGPTAHLVLDTTGFLQ